MIAGVARPGQIILFDQLALTAATSILPFKFQLDVAVWVNLGDADDSVGRLTLVLLTLIVLSGSVEILNRGLFFTAATFL